MRSNCDSFREGLTDLAHGQESVEASTHIAGCATCRAELAKLTRMVAGLEFRFVAPPSEVSHLAKTLIPKKPRLMARLAFSSLGVAGVRRDNSESFQASFESDGFEVRIAYSPEGSGWRIMGDASTACEIQWRDGELSTAADGRFEIIVPSADATALTFDTGSTLIETPSVLELRPSDPD